MKKWKCSVCDYVHEDDNPPGECPHCESITDVFSEQSSEEENGQKNTKQKLRSWVANNIDCFITNQTTL